MGRINNYFKYLDEIKNRGTITEKEIKRICGLLNNSKYKEDYYKMTKMYSFNGFQLEYRQIAKGIGYLYKTYFKKDGNPRNITKYLSSDALKIIGNKNYYFNFTGFVKYSMVFLLDFILFIVVMKLIFGKIILIIFI